VDKHLKILAITVGLILVLTGSAFASEVVIDLGWAETYDPLDHQASAAIHAFADYVETESAGEIKVELYPAAELGDADSMIEQVETGVIQACSSVPSGLIAGRYYSDANIFDIPYLFDNDLVAWETLRPDQEFFQDFSDSMADETGLRLLTFFIEGERHFTNDVREVRTPEDMEGLSIRTMEVPAHEIMVEALGAEPTVVAWPELYSALDTGVVDGQENPIANIEYISAYEVQDYLTLDGHITLLNTLIINEDFYQGLSQEHRDIIEQGAMVASKTNRGMTRTLESIGLSTLEDEGMEITELTPEELDKFVEATQPPVIEFIEDEVDDEEWIDRLLNEVDEARERLNIE